jgi:hypothetical protein
MGGNHQPSKDITPLEWANIRTAMRDTPFVHTIDILETGENEPRNELEILPREPFMSAEQANNRLRDAMLPFRLVRIGRLAERRGGNPIAIKRWPIGAQISMPGLGKRSYRK